MFLRSFNHAAASLQQDVNYVFHNFTAHRKSSKLPLHTQQKLYKAQDRLFRGPKFKVSFRVRRRHGRVILMSISVVRPSCPAISSLQSLYCYFRRQIRGVGSAASWPVLSTWRSVKLTQNAARYRNQTLRNLYKYNISNKSRIRKIPWLFLSNVVES